MRRQYHFRQIGEDTHIWDVHHLIQSSSRLAVKSIILCAEGKVMDGMHRVAKAALLKRLTIDAVQFKQTPPPDFINVEEDALDYQDD